ncbi:MAG: transposase [Bacteroidaceae bacterium]|nr:transposase [Bacteroidaceae bacterium]
MSVTCRPALFPVHEELIWKSYASNKLLAQFEVRKYMDHMPFNRQINQMKRDGLALAPSTINDWHVNVCDILVPNSYPNVGIMLEKGKSVPW